MSQNAVNLLNIPPNYDYVVSGVVIAAAAAHDVYRRRYVEAGLRKRTMVAKREKAAAGRQSGGPRANES